MTQYQSVLVFRDTQFGIVTRDNQPWLRGHQIGVALGYQRDDILQKLYRKHAAEFTDAMTALVKLPTAGGIQDVRIFSLRGAHLLGMFARTQRAAEFRRWVLDVLDRENARREPIATEPLDGYIFTPEEARGTLEILRDYFAHGKGDIGRDARSAVGCLLSEIHLALEVEDSVVEDEPMPEKMPPPVLPLSAIKATVESNLARFCPFSRELTTEIVVSTVGFLDTEHIYITRHGMKVLFGQENIAAVLRQLIAHGLLLHDNGRLTRKLPSISGTGNRRPYVYCINKQFVDEKH